LIGYKTKKEV
jgi:hypothetical protein